MEPLTGLRSIPGQVYPSSCRGRVTMSPLSPLAVMPRGKGGDSLSHSAEKRGLALNTPRMANMDRGNPDREMSCLTSLEPSETTPHRSWVDRDGERRVRPAPTVHQRRLHARVEAERNAIIDALNSAADPALRKRAGKMDNCCLCPLFVLVGGKRIATSPGFCRDRLCPTCQRLRAKDVERRLLEIVGGLNAPRFVTLTLRSNDDHLGACMDRLYESFRNLRRRPEWKARVRCGAAVCEVTRNAKTGQWHAHLHLVVDGEYFPQSMLSDLWLDVTGDSSVVDIRAVHARTDVIKYLSSYIAKGNGVHEWPPTAVCEYAEGMHGRRLLITFGMRRRPSEEVGEHGEVAITCEVLCSASKLVRAVDRGCPYGRFAAELLGRQSGWGAVVLGIQPLSRRASAVSLDDGDVLLLATALKRINGDDTAFIPFIEPTRRFEGSAWTGRTRPDATQLIWPDLYARETSYV